MHGLEETSVAYRQEQYSKRYNLLISFADAITIKKSLIDFL